MMPRRTGMVHSLMFVATMLLVASVTFEYGNPIIAFVEVSLAIGWAMLAAMHYRRPEDPE